jgi:hypothetical protein
MDKKDVLNFNLQRFSTEGKRVTGRLEVLINGVPLLNKEGAVASGIGISGEPAMELEAVMYDGGIAGYVEKPVAAKCEVTIIDREDVSLSNLAKVRENGTLIFRAAGGGKAYVADGATCTRNFSVTGGQGETTVVFTAPYWTELVQ